MSDTGLTQAEAGKRLARDGPNALPESRRGGIWGLLREVLTEPMFLLLVACGAVYLALGDRGEALMLLGFVVVVIGITFAQRRRAERSLDALRDLSSPKALVLRDGKPVQIDGRNLVVGDRVLLAEGDRVPADLVLREVANLSVDESLLTGESVPVTKSVATDAGEEAPAEGDAAGRVFSGTGVTQGTGQGDVIATGERSALGRIGQSLQGLGDERTPVQDETRRIVKRVAMVGGVLAVVLAVVYGVARNDALGGVLAGITLAMAILPEELPVVLTLFLGLGAWRLAREQVLARNMPAIELLGATTVLCVDKTGTLTANRMTVRELWATAASQRLDPDDTSPLADDLHGVLEFALLASHRRAFDPMEQAIGEAAAQLLAGTEHLHADWTLVDDYPLSPDMLAMSRVWQSPDQSARLIAAKGAPEAIVDLCHLDAARHAVITDRVAAMAGQGLRVLGVARALFEGGPLPDSQHDFPFEFLGLVALEDPLRADVPAAVAECHAAGIRVVMVTGDHPATALSIARQAGLPADGAVMTGADMESLDDAALGARLASTNVFCRVQPEQKLRLVLALRAQGEVVAMTGDGVNDAPALKAAHIGVAMGARGTDVARAAADLVLLKDDFASIVTAVRYGRRIFGNLRKAIVFVVAAHVPIVGLTFVPVLLGWPMLLMPVHILFLQLIIDPACSVVFEGEPLEDGAMKQPPRSPDARLFDGAVLWRGLWQGLGLLMLLLGVHVAGRSATSSDEAARALTFTVLVLSNLALIHANRSWRAGPRHGPMLINRSFVWIAVATVVLLGVVLTVPAVSRIFVFAWPGTGLLLAGLCGAAISLLWFEAVKWGTRRTKV